MSESLGWQEVIVGVGVGMTELGDQLGEKR